MLLFSKKVMTMITPNNTIKQPPSSALKNNLKLCLIIEQYQCLTLQQRFCSQDEHNDPTILCEPPVALEFVCKAAKNQNLLAYTSLLSSKPSSTPSSPYALQQPSQRIDFVLVLCSQQSD